MNTTPAAIASADQAAAADREFARKIAPYATAILAMALMWAVLTLAGVFSAAPWSPLGESQQPDGPQTVIPDERAPAPTPAPSGHSVTV